MSNAGEWLWAIVHRRPTLRRILSCFYQSILSLHWRIRKGPIAIATRHGSMFLLAEGHIAEAVWRSGFEESERKFVEHYLRPGMCVFNVGANAGLYAILAGKCVGVAGEVHAFEPACENVSRLRRNVRLNSLSNVLINHCAVSEAPGLLELCRDPTHPKLDSHFAVRPVGEGRRDLIETVESLTLDNYWSTHCSGRRSGVDMIIIDVEGAESKVLQGAMGLVSASPAVMIMAECTENLDEIAKLVRTAGLSFHLWNAAAARLERTEITRGNLFICR